MGGGDDIVGLRCQQGCVVVGCGETESVDAGVANELFMAGQLAQLNFPISVSTTKSLLADLLKEDRYFAR